MRRQKEDMQVNVAGLRRNIKNLAHNYSDAQVKVREATSNDPWGPSSTLMSEIADLTYNVVAFTEIMQMVWKRLNDHGRNWRHVYKALVLLEYLIKTGTEKVSDLILSWSFFNPLPVSELIQPPKQVLLCFSESMRLYYTVTVFDIIHYLRYIMYKCLRSWFLYVQYPIKTNTKNLSSKYHFNFFKHFPYQ